MKKLMFVAVAALSGSLFAEITSANVVGYQTVDVPTGFSIRTPSFKALNGSYKISDIGISGEINGWGEEFGQKTLADGTWDADGCYYYFTEEGSGGIPTGWYKDPTGDTPVTDEDIINEGEGFYFSSGCDFQFVFSGEVRATKTQFDVPVGFSMFGNPNPLAIKISDIEVGDGINGWGEEYGQKTLADGTWDTDGCYYYFTEEGSGGIPTGWYKDPTGDTPVTDEDILNPAEALYFSSGSEFSINLPAAL